MTEAQLQALEALQRRFIHTTSAKWDGVVDKSIYNDSIVFIYDENKKGTKIYTQGATFEMSNADDVKNIINEYLPGKGEGNIVVEYVAVDVTKPDGDKKLVIKEKSTGNIAAQYSIDENGLAVLKTDGDDSQLVQVSAVADALTTPMSLSAVVNDSFQPEGSDKTYTTASFTQNFTNLKGEKVDAVSAVLVEGENVTFENETGVGVKISATDTHYNVSTSDVYTDATQTATEGVSVDLLSSTSNNFTDTDEYNVKGSIEFVQGNDIKITRGTGDDVNKITIESTYVAPEETVYKGQEAIVIEDEKVGGTGEDKDEPTGAKLVTLKIDSIDKVLSQGTDGLKTTLTLNYDSETNKVQLLGNTVGEGDEATNVISEFDASAFVKDSFLKRANFVTVTDEIKGKDFPTMEGEDFGETAPKYPSTNGDYLAFVFNTVDYDYDEDGNVIAENTSNKVEFVPVTEFVKKGTITYTAAKTEGETTTPHSLTATTTNGTLADVTEVVNAITGYTAGAIAELDSTVTAAATVEDENKQKVTPENTVDVITSITQVDGKLSTVGSANVATTTYVDNAVTAATPTGELELKNSENKSDYVFAVAKDAEQKEKDGFVKASDLAAILNAAWGWGEIK